MIDQAEDHQGAASVQTSYILYDDGSVEVVTYTGTMPPMSKPGKVVGEVEYKTALARIEADNAAKIDDHRRREQERLKADYDALRELGIPDALARRLSGYKGA